ncbi:MAG: hypothetical protein DI539_22905 [Flavobacterium psychrophilum]|nr:MAG: hypothetical protein DI539_22905 [Flavobacterium psychrophilum]
MKKTILLIFILVFASCSEQEKITDDFASLPLPKYGKTALEKDFDILVSSLKEAHTGLYWYSSEMQFDSVVKQQRLLLKDSLNGLQFYNIVAPIVAYSKEDHCDISVSGEVSQFLKEKGKFIPLTIINLNQKPYIIHNADSRYKIDGWELTAVNGKPIKDIYHHIFNTFAADGYILSSKYRYLDSTGFAKEYARTIDQPDTIEITAIHPKTHQKKNFTLKTIGFNQLKAEAQALYKQGILKSTKKPANLKTDGNTAVLTINTFSNSNYEEAKMDFKKFIKESFETVQKSGIENLIIDMRENGGGSEGNEDYLFSFLTDKPYNKYKYVQASALSYSFYQYTDYKNEEDYKELEADLNKEHYKAPDGRILRRPGIQTPEPNQKNPFKGKVYVLAGGWTYSGGAEFCSLMREHTDAVFIGEEVGGGFYGNTSGYSFTLTLPNTKTEIEIPLLKFVLDVKKDIAKGRGIMPDYKVQPTIEQFLQGRDVEMDFAKKMIKENKL